MSHTSSVQGEPKIINTPGEFAFNSFTLRALGWQDSAGNERSLQRWEIEDMVLLHVGELNREMTDRELQELEKTTVDILFVPVGGGTSLNTKQALNLVTTIEPRMVIPINFQLPDLKEKLEGVAVFAKQMGADPKQTEKKLLVKAKHIPEEELVTKILLP